MEIHNIEPVFDKNSRILILGSFPSVKSRETKFFYGHPQNRFWKVLAEIFNCKKPETTSEKKKLLIDNGIALWDVIDKCEINGSADTSIKNVVPNDISLILDYADIQAIYLNGRTAEKYYNKYILPVTGIKGICLPSTSPANAARGFDSLVLQWQIIKEKL